MATSKHWDEGQSYAICTRSGAIFGANGAMGGNELRRCAKEGREADSQNEIKSREWYACNQTLSLNQAPFADDQPM